MVLFRSPKAISQNPQSIRHLFLMGLILRRIGMLSLQLKIMGTKLHFLSNTICAKWDKKSSSKAQWRTVVNPGVMSSETKPAVPAPPAAQTPTHPRAPCLSGLQEPNSCSKDSWFSSASGDGGSSMTSAEALWLCSYSARPSNFRPLPDLNHVAPENPAPQENTQPHKRKPSPTSFPPPPSSRMNAVLICLRKLGSNCSSVP